MEKLKNGALAIISLAFGCVCCWLPWLLVTLGLSTGVIASTEVVDQYRWVFYCIAAVSLSVALYRLYCGYRQKAAGACAAGCCGADA